MRRMLIQGPRFATRALFRPDISHTFARLPLGADIKGLELQHNHLKIDNMHPLRKLSDNPQSLSVSEPKGADAYPVCTHPAAP